MVDEPHNLAREAELDEIIAEFLQAEERDGPQDRQRWAARYPEHATELAEFLADRDRLQGFVKEPSHAACAPQTPQESPEPANVATPCLTPFPSQRLQPEIGSVFAGQYRIFGMKQGGMGRVYFADVIPLHRGDIPGKVAIKTIPDFEEWRERQKADAQPSDRAAYEHFAARFRQEAETWVKIGKQQNVIWAFFVMDVGSKPYIFMEYAEDGDLRTWIAQGRLSVPLAVNLAVQFCRGMTQAVEACHLVHRDIKPANVLLTKGYLLRISDFGLSKAYDAPETTGQSIFAGNSTVSQTTAGTVAYMAPEQFLSLSNADSRSDIYSFGVMLFEMVTGDRLFHGTSPREHLFQRGRPAPALHEIKPDSPPALSAILTRCLAFEPSNRYATFRDVEADLLAVHQGLPDPLPFPEPDGEMPHDWHLQSLESSLLSLGRFVQAAERAEEGARLFPRSAGHGINRAVALAHLGRSDESRLCLERATELEPANALAWANLGWARMENGDAQGGLQAARAATRLDPELAEGWWTLGECERRLGRIPEAIVSFRRAVEARPHDWRAYHYLGSCLLDADQSAKVISSEAIQALREAVHINPDDAEVWRLLAVALGKLGRQGEARQAIDRAITVAPDNSDAWAIRSVVFWQTEGPSNAARSCLKKSLALDGKNPRALQLLSMMGIHDLDNTR